MSLAASVRHVILAEPGAWAYRRAMRVLADQRFLPVKPLKVLAFCLVVSFAAPALAADFGDDDEAVTLDADEPAEAAPPVPVSTEGLYDFKTLNGEDPRYAALFEAFRKRQYGQAVTLSHDILRSPLRNPMQTAVVTLQAMALEAQKDWHGAQAAWQRLAQSGPMAQRARRHLAELALKRKDEDEALAQLAAIAPWHVDRDAATLEMAALELARGQTGPARDALDRIKPDALAKPLRAWWSLLEGQVAQRAGKTELATQRLREAWQLDIEPTAHEAFSALKALDAVPSAADQIERILRRQSSKETELRAWLREAESVTEDGDGLRLYVTGALKAREKNTRPQAIALLKQAVEKLGDPVQQARALLVLGDAVGKAGGDRAAIAILERIAQLPAGDETQARALQRLHKLYANVDEPKLAAEALQNVLAQHPAADERELVLWNLGFTEFRAKRWPEALQHFVQLDKDFGHLWTGSWQSWRAKALYWQGRTLAQMGQKDAALDAWTTVAQTYAQTYYGVIALDRMREMRPDRATRVQGPPPGPADGSAVQALSLDRLRVARHQALDEAALLVRMGLHTEAKTLLRDGLSRGLPRDGVQLLATLYDLEGHKKAAYAVMERHTRRAARPDDSTAGMWRQSFPRAFYPEAESAAKTADISKSFLYAIMRHESAFVPTAVSKAGAYGLVQLLPSAARMIAGVYDLPAPGVGGLKQPQTNLHIGALYLTQLLGFYRNNQALAAAAYNAGPYAVQAWVKKAGTQPTDVFVEAIPYPATRAYVMQVTATAQTYAWLYPEWQEIQRDLLSRPAKLPSSLGPFLAKPGASAALVN